MINKYQDINVNSEEGKMLLIAIGALKAYAKKINKPYNHPDDVIQDLKEIEISIDTDLILKKK